MWRVSNEPRQTTIVPPGDNKLVGIFVTAEKSARAKVAMTTLANFFNPSGPSNITPFSSDNLPNGHELTSLLGVMPDFLPLCVTHPPGKLF